MIVEKVLRAFDLHTQKSCLFLFDPTKEYKEELSQLPSNISVVEVDQKYFDLKIKISKLLSQKGTKILLYHPFMRPSKLSHYPLVGLLKISLSY